MANDKIKDDLLTASIQLEKFAAGIDKKAETVLKGTQDHIINELVKMDFEDPNSSAFKKNRLGGLYSRIDKILNKEYEKMGEVLEAELSQIPGLSQDMVANIMNDAMGVDVMTIGLSEEQLKSIVKNGTVDGGVLGDWMATQADNLSKAIRAQIADVVAEASIGILAGETTAEMVKRIRGTTTIPGLMNKSKKDLYSFVRTYTAQVAHDARMAMYEKYDYLLNGYEIVAVLDQRTTPLCRGYDGLQYTLKYKPIPPNRKKYPRAGGPPFHFNCRTVLVPITKTFEELSEGGNLTKQQRKDFDKLTNAERAALGGPIEQTKNYDQWLRKQSKARQIQVLGPKRWEIWKKRGLTMAQMLDQRGNTLTIEQLKRKYPRKVK